MRRKTYLHHITVSPKTTISLFWLLIGFFWQIGFKPAGGLRSAKDACTWLSLMKEELGDDWLKPSLFRIGASSLLIDIERQLFHYVTGRYAATHEFPMSWDNSYSMIVVPCLENPDRVFKLYLTSNIWFYGMIIKSPSIWDYVLSL